MKVKDLKEALRKLGDDQEVILYTEDQDLLSKGSLFKLFDIVSVDSCEAERCRLDDGEPILKFGKSDLSESLVTIELTGSF